MVFVDSCSGFASFLYILAFILLVSGALYISPVVCGSLKEKSMLRAPEELDSSYVPYTDSSVGSKSAESQV